MGFSYAEQQRQIRQLLAAKVKSYEKASEIVMKASAQKLARKTRKDLRSNFKVSLGSNFAKSVKQKNLPQKGAKGPASYVRIAIPWIGAFEEGSTAKGNPFLVILLPPGQKLGFPRKIKNEKFKDAKDRKLIFSRAVNDGYIYYLKPANKGKPIPIYKIQKAPVKIPKKLSFYATAEAIADDMPDAINQLME